MNEAGLKFHIEANDYFGTFATVLDLLGQDLRKHGQVRHTRTLRSVPDDLLFLQRRYRIEKANRIGAGD